MLEWSEKNYHYLKKCFNILTLLSVKYLCYTNTVTLVICQSVILELLIITLYFSTAFKCLVFIN